MRFVNDKAWIGRDLVYGIRNLLIIREVEGSEQGRLLDSGRILLIGITKMGTL